MYFNGTDSKLFIPQSTITFGNNSFTIEWWEYCLEGAVTRFCSFYTTDSSTYGGIHLCYNDNKAYVSSRTNSWDLVKGAEMIYNTTNEWVHWAFVRNGNHFLSYRNGSQYAATVLNGIPYQDSTHSMVIGEYRVGDSKPFKGYLEEFRISDIARWTGSFNPPTKPYL